MGGGGANSLDSPKIGENSDFTRDKNDTGLSEDNSKEEDTINEYTYKTYDDYFTDYDITAETITEDDFTGSGSATDPYLVHSTRGFLWLSKTYSFDAKYIELNSDIVLNDEKFDKEGNPSGGDGVVYTWEPKYANKTQFNGKNHKIVGLFIKDAVGYGRGIYYGFFSSFGKLTELSNLTIEDYYVQGIREIAAFAYTVDTIKNCHSRNGFVSAEYGVSGLVRIASKIIDCSNDAEISCTSASGGIAGIAASCSEAKNVINYGNISGVSYACGLFENVQNAVNCINYGDVIGTGIFVAGLVANCSNEMVLRDCSNYGKVTGSNASTAAFLGRFATSKNIVFENCKQYGEVCTLSGIGKQIYPQGTGGECIVKNCYFDIQDVVPLVGEKSKINIKNTIIDINGLSQYSYLFTGLDNDIGMQDCEINITGENVKFEIQQYYYRKNTKANLKNVLFNINNINLSIGTTYIDIKLEGVIINDIELNNHFYGTDFSGFYIDWKTGKIGLKALSGKGFYQGEVNEEVLKNKGFIKQEI